MWKSLYSHLYSENWTHDTHTVNFKVDILLALGSPFAKPKWSEKRGKQEDLTTEAC